MNDIHTMFEFLDTIVYSLDNSNFYYRGFIRFRYNKTISVHFEIQADTTIPDFYHKKERLSFVFQHIIQQGKFDYYIKQLGLIEYKDELLLYCGDLKQFYLVTKLYLDLQKQPLYKKIEQLNDTMYYKTYFFLKKFKERKQLF